MLSLCQTPAIAGDCQALLSVKCGEQKQLLEEYARKLQTEPLVEVLDQLEREIMLRPQLKELTALYVRLIEASDTHNTKINNIRDEDLGKVVKQGWDLQREIQVKEGYSNNFNRAPLNTNFILTIPNNRLLVQLDPKFQAQAGMGTDIQGELRGTSSISENLDWQLTGNAQIRQTEFDSYANYQLGVITSSWMFKHDGQKMDIAVVGGNIVRYDNDVKIYLAQAQLKRLWQYNKDCSVWAGADGYWQKSEQVANLSGVYGGATAGIGCQRNGYAYQFNIGSGEDFELENRLGAGQWRSRVMGQFVFPTDRWYKESALKLTASATYAKDEAPYSELLNNNAIRHYRRYEASIDYEFLLSDALKNLKAVSSLQWQKQDSNLNLFRSEAYEAWMGFKWKW